MSTYEISQSSLLSLKAEILRKQEEINKSKLENKTKRVPTSKPLELKNKGVEDREKFDLDDEEQDLLKKSKSILESKAKLYDKLSKRNKFTDEELEHNRRFLVRFDKKNTQPQFSDDEIDVDKYPEEEEEAHFSDEYEPPRNPEDEWVEYTDCLGRTRKCMRKDLQFLKTKDDDLRASIDKDENKTEQLGVSNFEPDKKIEEEEDRKLNEESELLSSDMRREMLRQQWEKEEEELRKKDDIHYQDVLFSEARTHGVGYYGFSKDEEERAKQQEALNKLRDETEKQQKRAQELKTLREKQLAARTKAARNRKRARMGLPPEEDEPEVTPKLDDNKVIEEENLKQKLEKEKLEEKKNEARKKHLRPWDIGKEGTKKYYEHTQEEWVDKQRKERKDEFAPPSSYKRSFRSEILKDSSECDSDKSLFFSSKRKDKQHSSHSREKTKTETINPYKTNSNVGTRESTPQFTPVQIVNECEDFDDVQDRLLNDFVNIHDDEANTSRGKGVEIAPPPTFDYYGPSDTKKTKPNYGKSNLNESISAGLQFLRRQAEQKSSSPKHASDIFLD